MSSWTEKPARLPFALLHIESTCEFAELLAFGDAFARAHGFSLCVHAHEEERPAGSNPFDHGERYTTRMPTTLEELARIHLHGVRGAHQLMV